jgi:ATP/maltotriose-dependent transcriptional regulator MalT
VPGSRGRSFRGWRLRDAYLNQQLIVAALQVRALQPVASRSGGRLAAPLTSAELRVLNLLPTTSYMQMAATLYISHNTVKSHLRSIYQKLGVSSRSEAIERSVDLRLLRDQSAWKHERRHRGRSVSEDK